MTATVLQEMTSRIATASMLAKQKPAPVSFADFIEGMPGLTEYARGIYLWIDATASRVGQDMAAGESPASLRERARDPRNSEWLRGHLSETADNLEYDPRYAALPSIRAWAMRSDNDLDQGWVDWCVMLMKAHVESRDNSMEG